MKISFIIPVYNVSNYIKATLDSIVNQHLPYDEYEIIAVDDGSTDNSLEILYAYKEELDIQGKGNLRIITQKNHGASAARNNGLSKAQGKYIWFVDGDDTIEPNSAESLLRQVEDLNLDILQFGLFIEYRDGHKDSYPLSVLPYGSFLDGKTFICKYGVPPNVWSSLYRREFLQNNNLCLLEGVVHEDLDFPPRAYCLAERISSSDIIAYNYLQREGSVMKTDTLDAKRKKSKDLLKICDSLYGFAISKGYKSDVLDFFMSRIAFVFSQSLKNYDSDAFPLSAFLQKPYYPIKISSRFCGKDKIKYTLMNCSLRMYLFLKKYIK